MESNAMVVEEKHHDTQFKAVAVVLEEVIEEEC